MSTLDCPPRRRVSVVVFGNRHKLELLVALIEAGKDGVNPSLLAQEQGVAPSVYYGPIHTLIKAGLVERLGRRAEDRRCWYRTRDGQFWEYMRAVVRGLSEVEVDEL